jgi:hypothetical protein
MEDQLVQIVNESLEGYLYDNASFLADLLCAIFPSEPNFFLLATCYHRSKQVRGLYRAR